LMKKITVRPDDALTAMAPKSLPNRITATMADGRKVSHQVNIVPGSRDLPMSRGDYESKFGKNVTKFMSERQQRQALEYLWGIDRQDNLKGLFDLFVLHT
jgi:2-methylcitrate dehydratase